MADLNREADELAEILARVNDEMRRFGSISQETADDLAAGSTRRSRELKAAAASSVQSLSSLAGAAMSSGRAMLEGQKGATAFNSALDDLTAAATAAGVALTFLIPGGPAIKAFVAGVTLATTSLLKYTQAANKLADDLYKGYSGLAKSGAAAADGMSGLFEDAKKLGLSMGELGDLSCIIGANSKDMALLVLVEDLDDRVGWRHVGTSYGRGAIGDRLGVGRSQLLGVLRRNVAGEQVVALVADERLEE